MQIYDNKMEFDTCDRIFFDTSHIKNYTIFGMLLIISNIKLRAYSSPNLRFIMCISLSFLSSSISVSLFLTKRYMLFSGKW